MRQRSKLVRIININTKISKYDYATDVSYVFAIRQVLDLAF